MIVSQETRRRQQAEAAEKRQKELEGRGVKDPEALKRKQQRKEEMEKQAEQTGSGDSNLKVAIALLICIIALLICILQFTATFMAVKMTIFR